MKRARFIVAVSLFFMVLPSPFPPPPIPSHAIAGPSCRAYKFKSWKSHRNNGVFTSSPDKREKNLTGSLPNSFRVCKSPPGSRIIATSSPPTYRTRCRDRPCGFARSADPRAPETRRVFAQTCAGYCAVKTSVPTTTRTYPVRSKSRAPLCRHGGNIHVRNVRVLTQLGSRKSGFPPNPFRSARVRRSENHTFQINCIYDKLNKTENRERHPPPELGFRLRAYAVYTTRTVHVIGFF